MEVKTALIIFGACLIVGLILLVIVTPRWAQTLSYDDAYNLANFSLLVIFIGFLGFIGTLVYWFGTRLKKWMLGY